jgi:hypothetical protein
MSQKPLYIGIASLLGVMFIAGCMSAPIQPGATPNPASAVVNMPARKTFDEVQKALSNPPINLGVTESNDGVMMTGYEQHKGDFHIGRHWQERTRYRVAIVPDFNDPTGRSRIEIWAQSEERAAEGQRWDPNPSLHRPERAEALLKRILSQIQPG